MATLRFCKIFPFVQDIHSQALNLKRVTNKRGIDYINLQVRIISLLPYFDTAKAQVEKKAV